MIQVCADLDDPVTWQRETRALLNVAQEYPQATLYLISLEPDQGAAELPPSINWRPATAWLLQDSPLESG